MTSTRNWPRPWPPGRIIGNVWWRLPHARSPAAHIFVVGAPRSGTTLVQLLLAAHPELTSCPGETGIFTWQEKSRLVERDFGLEPDEATALIADARDCVTCLDAIAERNCANHGAARFIEKTPQHVFRLRTLRDWYPNAQFVHVVRDGRDCLCSARSHPGIPQRRKTPQGFAAYWKRCLEARRAASGLILDVRYESLVRDPPGETEKLMTFLGLECDKRQLEPAATAGDPRSALPHFRRLGTKIGDASVGQWRSNLSSAEIKTFEGIAGRTLGEWGYPPADTRRIES